MTKKNLFVTVSTILLFVLGFTIDDSPLQQIIEKLKKYSLDYPQEKVHLQTDKPYYIAGEEIWLKAYVVVATANQHSELSKILYVDLINETNQISKKITLAVDSGRAFGQLTLPDSLSTGNYRIRAYTNYMRNFDHEFFFEKFVSITNIAEVAKTKPSSKTKEELDVQFFPEGGNLIYGLRSKVGIKIINQNGLGVNLAGYIIDENQEKVAVFSAEHAGIGSFALNPIKGKNYKAILEKEDGSKLTYNLPKIQESGYNLSVNSIADQNNVSVKIAASPTLINNQELSLIAQSGGKIYYTTTAKVDNAILTANIPKSGFPTGIVQFTLFDDKLPIAERIIFINHNDQIKINVNASKILGGESKTNINLLITDENENPLDGNFSIAVVDAEKVTNNEDNETTILSNLLLTSDLKGYIEQPNYYFNNINPDKERQLDHLLLTQGWRRFVWKDILAGKEIAIINKLQQSTTISGMVTNLNNKPIPKAKVILMSVSSGFDMLLDTLADENGRFTFDRLDITDTLSFILQAKIGSNKDIKIVVDDAPRVIAKKPLIITDDMISYVISAKKLQEDILRINPTGIKLNQVTITGKKELKPIENVAHSKSRNGFADYTIGKEKLLYQTGDIFNAFYSIPGVRIQNGQIIRAKANTVSMAPNFQGKPQPMQIILDGAVLPDQDLLKNIPASTVEGIEVLTSNYNTVIYDDGYWGVILITTKMGKVDKPKNLLSTNLAKVTNFGLSLQKQFYKPFKTASLTNAELNKIVNNSTTVYWNPNVNANVNGKATIQFSNTESTNYRITIEGMDVYGKFGRKVITYLNK
ncbi:hypothetical protein FA048_01530 [Pedobacter polaris]|uniref:TonB-dependent receptor plug domain-containing protein n=1 Tax=Pedobacter polaris TaxID=2571273 RepID=A0A4U1CT43_9SPHI|nr:hypothetical protein [Pedobacter polaris]TKC12327.1 hypothetical protein FA048_01530 [Pedobacter polaris]